MKNKAISTILLIMLVALVLQGCGPAAPTPVPTAAPTATAAAAEALPAAAHGDKPVDLKGATNAGEPTPISCDDTTDDAFVAQVITLVNAERANVGAPPLTENPKLTAAARVHNSNMLCLGFLDHTGRDGTTPDQRIEAQGYLWANFGENIASSYTTPEAAMAAWMNSQGHRENILFAPFTEIGVAYSTRQGPNGREIKWTQVFGLARPEPTPTPVPPTPTSCGAATNDDFTQQVIALVNAERAKAGVPALTEEPRITAASRVHTMNMACLNFFSVGGQDGLSTRGRVTAQGYDAASLTENIAGGLTTPEAVVQFWMGKNFERGNILSPNYTVAGAGYASKEGTDKVQYWSMVFGRPQR